MKKQTILDSINKYKILFLMPILSNTMQGIFSGWLKRSPHFLNFSNLNAEFTKYLKEYKLTEHYPEVVLKGLLKGNDQYFSSLLEVHPRFWAFFEKNIDALCEIAKEFYADPVVEMTYKLDALRSHYSALLLDKSQDSIERCTLLNNVEQINKTYVSRSLRIQHREEYCNLVEKQIAQYEEKVNRSVKLGISKLSTPALVMKQLKSKQAMLKIPANENNSNKNAKEATQQNKSQPSVKPKNESKIELSVPTPQIKIRARK